jgi:tetratricopeptide (TPR) repeat protein
MKKLFVLFLIALFSVLFSKAKEILPSQLVEQGNNYFKEKKYALALESYKEIELKGYSSADLFYNIGTTYYKLDSLGKASLYLQRAGKLSPFDEDIAFNIQLVNANTIDKMDSFPQFFLLRWWNAFISFFHPDIWAYITLFFVFLTSGFLLLFWLSALHKKRSSYMLLFLIFAPFSGLSFLISFAAFSKNNNQSSFVVISNSADVYSAPVNNSTKLFVMHEGAAGEILEEQLGWVNAKFPNGTKGWINLKQIGKY